MTDDTSPTGTPGRFRRWQQPADAPTDAGRLPNPYPLERILFCAGCDLQFFGAHQFSGARVYCVTCDCRPRRSIVADEVERRTYAEVHALVFGTDPVTGLTNAHYALLAFRLFTRVVLGLTVNDLAFIARI